MVENIFFPRWSFNLMFVEKDVMCFSNFKYETYAANTSNIWTMKIECMQVIT